MVDQTGLLGDRNEFGRRHDASQRMVPADQGLEARRLVVFRRHQRLVVEHEFAILEGLAQFQLEHAAFADIRIHLRFEEAEGGAAFGLGPIKR